MYNYSPRDNIYGAVVHNGQRVNRSGQPSGHAYEHPTSQSTYNSDYRSRRSNAPDNRDYPMERSMRSSPYHIAGRVSRSRSDRQYVKNPVPFENRRSSKSSLCTGRNRNRADGISKTSRNREEEWIYDDDTRFPTVQGRGYQWTPERMIYSRTC
ncbi:hypothetical protein B0H19DRAFT_126860 [Mycena capillaripes]|nr:hypothetical protein B0H19DRAFT_126860 [Mycena capillaripes]